MRRLFDRIDSFQFNGEIDAAELWNALGPILSNSIDEIQVSWSFDT
jgi:hypothetical protein